MYEQESVREDRFVTVKIPHGGKTRMLLPRQYDGGWPFSREMLDRIAQDDGSVLITGETGTGKELLAYYLWNNSHRREKPFVAINCAGLTEQLMRSELFGHEEGAFTGATAKYLGRVGEADGGTLFLDEIGVIDRSNQTRLLRFMQTGEIEPVGGQTRKAKVRIIAATNRPVIPASGSSDLILDLFYRFRFNNLTLPPLRDRQSDIFRLLLEANFLGKEDVFTGITIPTLLVLAAQDWSGNIRELKQYCDDVRFFGDLRCTSVWVRPPDRKGRGVRCKHIFHDIKLCNSESLDSALEFCLRIAAEYYCSPHLWSEHFWKTLHLVCSFREGIGSSIRYQLGDSERERKDNYWTYVPVRSDHIAPLSALREDLEHGENKPWESFDFTTLTKVFGGKMQLPNTWQLEECSLAEALANLGYYCRLQKSNKKGFEAEITNTFSNRDRNIQLASAFEEAARTVFQEKYNGNPITDIKMSVQELVAEIVKHGGGLPLLSLPEPPSTPNPAFEELFAQLDLSTVRKHKENIEGIREVLQLYHLGLGPKDIQSRMKGSMTINEIRGIERTHGFNFKPKQKPLGGRPSR